MSVTGLVRSDFVVRAAGIRDHSLGDGDHVPYPVADPASDSAHADRARHAARRAAARFRAASGSSRASTAAATSCRTRRASTSRAASRRSASTRSSTRPTNPPLAGLGLAAIRDAVTRLKHEGAPELGLDAESYDRALAFGISQSGRVLRTFLYEGFNADERNRRVFDGVLAHIAGGARGGFNTRFAQPSRSSSSYLYPNEVFPFSDAVQTDAVERASRDGLLERVGAAVRPANLLHELVERILARLGRADARDARRPARLRAASARRASISSRARSTGRPRFRRASARRPPRPTTRTRTRGSCARCC